ncbi:chemotaxis protein [Brevibacillus sp. SYSU BS000544]|uniref:chemotaxis protein n=1 Tax=Brevibacillus sp. SYSU BS000544 TaxID=3416443 RepID=UPI003CE4EB43
MERDSKGILLESGTNELEIVEFTIGNEHYGINVIKVREIIALMPPTKLPNSHPSLSGVIHLRGEILPVINLAKVLGYPPREPQAEDRYIITEMNQLKVAFHVHAVSRIHRISWTDIEKPTDLAQGEKGGLVGVIKFPDKMVLLLDFEKIVVDMNPASGIHKGQLKDLGPRQRSTKKIMIAEDSAILRKLLEETLSEAGYSNLYFCRDGKEAWDALEANQDRIKDFVQLMITDIEMPQMDGLHLTKRVKDHPKLRDMPVVIFSSLISDELRHKGEQVGANAQLSKPDIVNLIKVVDELVQ